VQLNPKHQKIADMLNGRLFRIPEYQRAYAWGPRQRQDLFHDIREAYRSGREHFMATVVALQRETREIDATEFSAVELVDGQQRITTIIILLKAIERALDAEDPKEEKLKREIGDLLVKGDDHSLVLLQTNHDSSNIFAEYLRTGEINEGTAVTAADKNLVSAAHECEGFVDEWQGEASLIELVSTVRNRLSMIYHEVADEATVYRVFEVLNSRGLDVKWIDKLKSQLMSLLFEHSESGSRKEVVHEMHVMWQGIYRVLGQRAGLGDEALRFAGTWVRPDRPNRIISEEDASGALAEVAGTEIQTIAEAAVNLKGVVEAVHALHENVRLRAVTRILHARFVAVAIVLRKFPAVTEADLLERWERVTFRVFGLAAADARNKVGEYVRLGYDILNRRLSSDAIASGLAELGTGFEIEHLLTWPNLWSDCYNGWTEEVRYLLYRYDEHLAREAGEKLNHSQWNKIWTADASKSIEHIRPQSNPVSYTHHLGNLTMLPPGVNSSLRDKRPEEKAAAYKSCGLRATAEVGRAIEDGQRWDKAAVETRANQIEEFVREEWK